MTTSEVREKSRLEKATKLSELLEIAIDDLKKIEATPGYEVAMDVWIKQSKSDKICYCCLAGATLICENPELIGKANSHLSFINWIITTNEMDKRLHAINELRLGDIEEACFDMNVEFPSDCRSGYPVKEYDSEDTEPFFESMQGLLMYLKEQGL